MLTSIDSSRLASLGATDLSDELEHYRVVGFPESPLPLPPQDDLRFLRETLPPLLSRKNPSYHHESGRLSGIRAPRDIRERTSRILRAHSANVRAFLERVLPTLVPGWRVGTTSFRPMQERGREIDAHKSSERLHVDARAYGATHGDRILRFFVNANPSEERVWISRGPFPDVHARYAAEAGIDGPHDLRSGLLNRLFSGAVAGLGRLWPTIRLADTSPYDRLMGRFHNFMKDSQAFQESPDGRVTVRFKPYSAWMVFTDSLSHACVSGQHAFIDTFIIPLRNCRFPELTPYHILRTGRLAEQPAALSRST
jgi:hypothetical protein